MTSFRHIFPVSGYQYIQNKKNILQGKVKLEAFQFESILIVPKRWNEIRFLSFMKAEKTHMCRKV